MNRIEEIELQLAKSVAEIQAQTRMLSMDAALGGTAEVAIARLRAIEEHAERAEALLARIPPTTKLFGHSPPPLELRTT